MQCILQFQDDTNLLRLKPLLSSVFEFVLYCEEGDWEEYLVGNICVTLMQMANYSNKILAPYLDKVIEWYILDPNASLSSKTMMLLSSEFLKYL